MAAEANKKDGNEATIYVPWDILDACNGFSFDIGGSVIKAVYIHRDDWTSESYRTTKKGALRLVSFSREEIPEALSYVKERAHIKRDSPDHVPLIYTTGIGGSQFMREIRHTMNVESKNLSEGDCFIQAHRFMLEHQTQVDLVHTISEKAIQQVEKQVRVYSTAMANMHESKDAQTGMALPEITKDVKITLKDQPDPEKTFIECGDVFPNMLVMCGSAGAVLKVNKDGTFLNLDMMYRCGRMFLGLGCVVTGAKTYDELMALAEKGDARKVHQDLNDVTKGIPKEDDSLYSNFSGEMSNEDMDEMFTFLFGKAVGKSKDEFRREDLARALVISAANDLVQTVSLITANPDVVTKDVFFCGNYVAHPLMRHFVSVEWGMRETTRTIFFGKEMRNVHFLKHGGHYGALGALLNHKLKFTDNMAEMQVKGTERFKKELGIDVETK